MRKRQFFENVSGTAGIVGFRPKRGFQAGPGEEGRWGGGKVDSKGKTGSIFGNLL